MNRPMKIQQFKQLIYLGGMTLLTWLFIGIFALEVYAIGGTVSTSNVNVRAEASADSASVGAVNQNDRVDILEEQLGADGMVWYKVTTATGITGYIRSDFVTKDVENQPPQEQEQPQEPENEPEPEPEPEPETVVTPVTERTAYIAGEVAVNIRRQASTGSARVATAQGKSEITIIGEATGTDGRKWYQIKFAAGGAQMTGFVRSDLITFEAPEQDEEVTEIEGDLGGDEEQPSEEESTSEETGISDDAQKTEVTADVSELMVLEPDSMLENIPAGFEQIDIMFGENSVTAWAKDDFYIFYASKSGETPQWYLYDMSLKGYVKYNGLFPAQPVMAPQEEESSFNWVTFILVDIIVIMAAAIIFLIVLLSKKKNADNDDDMYDYDEDDYEEDEEEQADSSDNTSLTLTQEMNYVNQRPMENKSKKPATVIMPNAENEDDMYEDEEEEFEEEEPVREKKKKKGFKTRILDYFTTEVEEDGEEEEEDEDDRDGGSSDDDLDFIDL